MLNFLKNRRVEKQQQKVDALIRDIETIQALQETASRISLKDKLESVVNSLKDIKHTELT